MSPISDEDLVIDLALDFEYPLLIVVPNVLGCINSTLLTVSAARAAGLSVFGIVLNDTMHPLDSSATSNRSEISRLTDVPVVAHVDFGANELAVEKFSELFN